MAELLQWQMDGGSVVVEVDDEEAGFQPASLSFDGTVYTANERFETALAGARRAAEKTLATFRDLSLRPDGVELEFGIKLNAAAGAVIAKAATEAHLQVKLTWKRSEDGTAKTDGTGGAVKSEDAGGS